ncbi:HAUS augmin-like complex subunit 7 [Dunckerocampus dactyliophorus]|uniref:HAUS augmin-like complex subunit 7 n=1 Tax=Dunckerocampus dactyliophorus TaxID=161453 RepID=UPI002406B462|nr:HAUS augmin-like complex subunit 7 [Dunckerocampus dactyliophorus]
MADSSNETALAHRVYTSLLAAPCPLLESVYLQDPEDMLQLLCTPSQLRTDILTWICCSIDPNFASLKDKASKIRNPDILIKGIAALGQDLMLCKGDNLDLIKGDANCRQQLQFFVQLLDVFLHSNVTTEHGAEMLLDTLFTAESLPHLTQMLTPSLDLWPSNITALHKSAKSNHKPGSDNAENTAALIQSTRSVLEKLQSECDVLKNEVPSARVFTPSALHLAMGDLQQLMTTFCHMYETDLRACCTREPPNFSTETEVFQRVYELLLACNTELEMLTEVSGASTCVSDQVSQLQTKVCCGSQGKKGTLSEQLDELNRRYKDFVSRLHPSVQPLQQTIHQ